MFSRLAGSALIAPSISSRSSLIWVSMILPCKLLKRSISPCSASLLAAAGTLTGVVVARGGGALLRRCSFISLRSRAVTIGFGGTVVAFLAVGGEAGLGLETSCVAF